MSNNKQRQMLWDRKMAQWDYESQITSAERRGEKRGHQAGWDEAKKAADDRDRRRVRIMFADGDSPEKIARSMEMSVAQVREWIQ